MKQTGAVSLQDFEIHLATVAAKCEVQYGFNGLTGFLYDSVKDQLEWVGLSVKHYVGTVMEIGRYMVMKDEDFAKVRLNSKSVSEMSEDDINKLAGV
ncbi:MAG: hypothetical protein DRO01_05800 [Thermoproteota archaeon]|nr:MAG: hypothetical protein DRO01_05800 [Candidatus Korarchaeota archaeon]